MKANEKQKEFLTMIINELTTLREGDTNSGYCFGSLERFSMCSMTEKDMLSVKDAAKLNEAMDTILNLTRGLVD